jgi:hypothetical protein
MSIFKEIKKMWDDAAPKGKNRIQCKVVRGTNRIFTKKFEMTIDEEGTVYINNVHKVKLINCVGSTEKQYLNKKSTGKKLLGAAGGGIVAGPFGAVIGALSIGNNGVQTKKDGYLTLTFLDSNNLTHKVTIEKDFGTEYFINKLYLN